MKKNVSVRVRHVSGIVQRQWRYRFTLIGEKRDEITRPASGDKREHSRQEKNKRNLFWRNVQYAESLITGEISLMVDVLLARYSPWIAAGISSNKKSPRARVFAGINSLSG